jgi:hypothetical protein
VLDMDWTEIPVYAQQEQSSYNGHFESTCYHPLLLFNGEGGLSLSGRKLEDGASGGGFLVCLGSQTWVRCSSR